MKKTPILLLAFFAIVTASCVNSDLEQRRAEVAEVGAEVMPFDLDRMTHIFQDLEDGGLQTIVSDDGDTEQVRLIRAHLSEEAARFASGNFHGPSMIHGAEMPGLHALVTGHDRLKITYSEIEGGAEVSYATEDSNLVNAIHEWFRAQIRDHGEHAQPRL